MKTQNQGDKNFEGLLGLYLKQSQAAKKSITNQPHLDEDILSAFVEATLTEQQSIPVLKHLIECAFCRRVILQLTKLSENLDDAPLPVKMTETNNWSNLWSNLTESLSRSYDNIVVAHEAKENSEEKRKDEFDE